MKISVDIRGIDAVKAHVAGLGGQVAYAASRALNATATKVVEAMPAEIERAIDRPVPFTKRGVAILGAGARKDRLAVTNSATSRKASSARWSPSPARNAS